MKIVKITNVENFVEKIIPNKPQKNYHIVQSIINQVKNHGDSALKKYEKKFSGAKITTFRVTQKEIKDSYNKVSKQEIAAIKLAKNRLEKTESKIKSVFKNQTITHDRIKISKKFIPLQKIGCYI